MLLTKARPCCTSTRTNALTAKHVFRVPVEAIFHEDDVPEGMKEYIQLNAEMAPKCPSITERKKPLADNNQLEWHFACEAFRVRGISLARRPPGFGSYHARVPAGVADLG